MIKKIILLLIIVNLIACKKKENKKIVIMCGIANKLPITKISKLFTKKTGIKTEIIYGSGGMLLSQLKYGKKGDIYLAGSPEFLNIAKKNILIYKNTIKKIAYFIPAILVLKQNKKINLFNDILKNNMKFAISNPKSTAIGRYALEIIDKNYKLNIIKKIN